MNRGKDGRRPGVRGSGSSNDPWRDPGWKAFAAHAVEDLVPKVFSSGVCLAQIPENLDEATEIDMQAALELGVMILMNKPMIGILPPGGTVPNPKIAKVFDKLIELDPNNPDQLGREIAAFAYERGLK